LELEVLIVDCQTTGATPRLGSVLELGWCVTRASEPERDSLAEAHWIALPAGQRVSAQVRELTGFHEGLAAQAIAAELAWQRLRANLSARPMPTAIHFARFELTFLRDWSERFEPDAAFPIDALCVHAIACRLYPDLPRRNLRALAGFLGHGLHLERRSLGHVQATAFIWRKLAAELSARGLGSWAEVSSWLAAPPEKRAPRKRSYPIARERYRGLPDQPGVYRFLRSNGELLYVGKAASLKKRVTSHFTKQSGATERALEMLTQVSDIQFTATESALEAALLETDLIKSLEPPYNVQLVQGDRGAWFVSSDFDDASLLPDAVRRVGPLPSRFSLRSLRVVIELTAGEPASLKRRAAAVFAPTAWAPDEATFASGWALFVERHLAHESPEASARRRSVSVADKLLRLSNEAALSSEQREASDDAGETAIRVWDAERVCRHIERSLAQAYQVWRRAAWLCLLADSAVYFREPKSDVGRELRLEAARLTHASAARGEALQAPPVRPPRVAIQQAFDAARYDQLRILSSELKRILRDGGDVAVRLSRTRLLSGALLRNVLRVV
jgi:DNA polymerase-3 subunit epsilon